MFRSAHAQSVRPAHSWRRGLAAVTLSFAMLTAGASSAFAADTYTVEVHPRRAEGAMEAAASDARGNLTYKVQPGDSLSQVASLFGFTELDGWRVLYDANRSIDNPHLIEPGQTIRIPEHAQRLTRRSVPAPAPVTESSSSSGASSSTATESSVSSSQPSTPAASGSVWDLLAQCESGGNWAANTGNGFYGGLQFTLSSWQAVGGAGYPHEATKAEQIARAQQLQAIQGWGAWPACSAELGL